MFQRDKKFLVLVTVWLVIKLPSISQRPLEVCCTV